MSRRSPTAVRRQWIDRTNGPLQHDQIYASNQHYPSQGGLYYPSRGQFDTFDPTTRCPRWNSCPIIKARQFEQEPVTLELGARINHLSVQLENTMIGKMPVS